MNDPVFPRLRFNYPFGEREAYEAEARGFLDYATVELEEGLKIPVVFYDPTRLRQDLEEESRLGNPFIAEAGMIVLESVTLSNMENAIKRLFRDGFFRSFRNIE